jgi:hypothetical protein
MIIGIQLVGIIFSFSMIYFAILHFKRREINLIEIGVWLLVWSFALVAVLFPDILQTFARSFMFARLFDMMVVGAIIIVMIMTVRSYVGMRKIENKLEDFVRKEAFGEFDNKHKK